MTGFFGGTRYLDKICLARFQSVSLSILNITGKKFISFMHMLDSDYLLPDIVHLSTITTTEDHHSIISLQSNIFLVQNFEPTQQTPTNSQMSAPSWLSNVAWRQHYSSSFSHTASELCNTDLHIDLTVNILVKNFR